MISLGYVYTCIVSVILDFSLFSDIRMVLVNPQKIIHLCENYSHLFNLWTYVCVCFTGAPPQGYGAPGQPGAYQQPPPGYQQYGVQPGYGQPQYGMPMQGKIGVKLFNIEKKKLSGEGW